MTKEKLKEKAAAESSIQQTNRTKIEENVITTIVGLAVSKVEGVAGMEGKLIGNLAEKIGRKDLTKGIKVETDNENTATVEVTINVKYGTKIQEVAKKVQNTIKEAVKSMTGFEVPSVTVNVQGVELEEYLSQVENSKQE